MQPSNRIEQRFAELGSAGRCALITYVSAGDPSATATIDIMHTLVRGGADIIELGVPFSDPMADGPVIQRACERALAGGMSLQGVIDIVREFRADDGATPVVLMGYLNPIEAMGYARFAELAAAAGVDGVLIVDVPPEEAHALNGYLRERRLDQIFLLAPNSTPARVARVSEFARGFVYYVSVKGVTGGKNVDAVEVETRIAEFRQKLTLPIGVGFGIKSASAAAAVARAGDAVIVGSSIIEIIEREAGDVTAMRKAIESFVTELRVALDRARAA